MKRIALLSIISLLAVTLHAQSSIDRLFEKYQGKDGFVTVTINGNLLKMLGSIEDEDDDDLMRFADKFTAIRIIAQEEDYEGVENFYDAVIAEINRGGYEEMMTVNSSDADVKILVKGSGRAFEEFLVIAGGESNAIIQIKGSFTSDDVKKMSESVKSGDSLHGIGMFN
ncbi:MAG: DUF4252 domain-containing protein [Bacteroidales bacterium]